MDVLKKVKACKNAKELNKFGKELLSENSLPYSTASSNNFLLSEYSKQYLKTFHVSCESCFRQGLLIIDDIEKKFYTCLNG